MKKILSILLMIAVIASVLTVSSLNTAAAGGKLTVTSRGEVLGEVEVGNEFIFNVACSSGGYSVKAAEGAVYFDSDYVRLIDHGVPESDGSVSMNAYSFPQRILNSSLITNYFEQKDEIVFNFAKIDGIGEFNEDDHFFKVRFLAVAPGTVDISYDAKVLYTRVNKTDIKLIYHNKPNDQLNPIPYVVTSVESASGYVGDADGDYALTVMDATYIQYLTAGVNNPYKPVNADVDNNGEVNLRDALNILRYKAGIAADTRIGEWIFDSEQLS